MNVLIIGAVGTTAITIEMLHKHNFNIVGVLGHEPVRKKRVTGIFDLKGLCDRFGIDYQGFQKINDFQHIDWAKQKKPEIIFAVGFSQLLKEDWLSMAKYGCVGFHPTFLPIGRGRAPVAWSILEQKKAAANFFLMSEGMDNGPIFVQEVFDISSNDDATSFGQKLREHMVKALDKWLPNLKEGIINPILQDESKATYYGKREPCDSLIDWHESAENIDRLIKASTIPHDGSFTFFKESLVKIWKSKVANINNYKGVIGRILIKDDNRLLVQCGFNTNLWIENFEVEGNLNLNVGDKLGDLNSNKLDAYINNKIWNE